ncbi:MAG: arginase family protein [Nanoarchaeota archaeon]|nr:arginase family protein [Nanoarchaeota archaeon]
MKVVGIPFVNALGIVGAEKAPRKIFTELGVGGEIIEVDNSNIEESIEVIYKKALGYFDERVSFVGGDHSITYPLFKAFQEKFEKPFLIVFDAHADCMPPMTEPTHEEVIRGIIDDGFDPQKIILVGVRKIEKVERDYLNRVGVKVFEEVYDLEACADYVTEKAIGHDIYVSVDIDVLDPAFAPGVSYIEPNGMSTKELFYILRRIFFMKGVRALDVVEVIPKKDEKSDYLTVKTAAKIIKEFWAK